MENLKVTIRKITDGKLAVIEIRCNDECKNGHADFSLTATFYSGKREAEAYFDMGGCCHKEILKVMPELKIFADLHLSNENGEPMYATANGLYHIEGFLGIADHGHKATIETLLEYFRLPESEIHKLVKAVGERTHKVITDELLSEVHSKYYHYKSAASELEKVGDAYASELKKQSELYDKKWKELRKQKQEERADLQTWFNKKLDQYRPLWKAQADEAIAFLLTLKEQSI